MLIIRKNQINNLIATVSMNKTLPNPYYLFSFQHIASKERVSFLPEVIISNTRYDKFRFSELGTTNLNVTPPQVNFEYLGQYYYSIYEQVSSANTDPSLAFNKLESGRAVVIAGNDNLTDCVFEPYISDDENFAQVIYVSDDESVCIPSVTPTSTPSQTPSLTPTETPTSTPTETPTLTPTPSITPTLTPTTTCPVTTQYLEVDLSENTKFKLILWNQSDFTSPANALCDYVISGCAYGDLGTIYCGEETIDQGQHQHQFDLAPVLLPGEIVTGFTVGSYYTVGCPCPLDLVTCVCKNYRAESGGLPITVYYTDCNGNPQSESVGAFQQTEFCACQGSVSGTLSTIITDLGPCIPISPTPSVTPTETPTNTPTMTPSPTSGYVDPATLGATWWSQYSNSAFLNLTIPGPGSSEGYINYVIDGVDGSTFFQNIANSIWEETAYSAATPNYSGAGKTDGFNLTRLISQNGDYTGNTTDWTFFARIKYNNTRAGFSEEVINVSDTAYGDPLRWYQIKVPSYGNVLEIDVWADPNTATGFVVLTPALASGVWTNIAIRAYNVGTIFAVEYWENGTLVTSGSSIIQGVAPIGGPRQQQWAPLDFCAEQSWWNRKLTDSEMTDMFGFLTSRYG